MSRTWEIKITVLADTRTEALNDAEYYCQRAWWGARPRCLTVTEIGAVKKRRPKGTKGGGK